MDNQPTIIPTTGARSGDPIGQIREIVDLKERGWIDPARMVTHRFGFNEQDVNAAYRMYENREDNVLKVVLNIDH
jgi:threonine dehydrogenase-like Zn-dependent dehydrogenase